MKKPILWVLTATVLFVSYGCSPKPDSSKTAEETNDSLIDKATPVQAQRLAADSKSNAKDVAEFMIAIADAGQTVRALSELGVGRATNPAIKTFARQVLDQQRTHETSITDIAKTFAIVLPKALSTDSETIVNRLRDQKAGPGFDKAYLRDMVSVDDMAMGKAKNLTKNADSPSVKNLALTSSSDNEKQLKAAQKLMEAD